MRRTGRRTGQRSGKRAAGSLKATIRLASYQATQWLMILANNDLHGTREFFSAPESVHSPLQEVLLYI